MKSFADYWLELKARGVLTAVVIYAVAGFVLLLATDVLGLLAPLPAWLHPLLVKTALLGLPITIVVSWMYSVRPEVLPVGGRDLDAIQEQEHSRSVSRWKTTSIIAGMLAVTAFAGASVNMRATPDAESIRMVVAPFENTTGNARFDDVAGLAADGIATRLTQIRRIDVVPYTSIVAYTVTTPLPPRSTYERAIELARGVDASLVVWGSYYTRGDSVRFSGQITDARTGDLVRDIRPAQAPAARIADAVAQFRENVVATVARQAGVRPAPWPLNALPLATPSAHAAFSDALQHYAAADYAGALRLLRSAAQTDSTFVLARIWLARVLAAAGDVPAADSVARALEPYRARLTPYDRAQLDHVQATGIHSLDLRYGASTLMSMIAPGADDGQRLLAIDALALNHPREARSVLLGLNPNHGWIRGWPGYFANLALAYHVTGDYHDEQRVALNGLRRFPNSLDLLLADCRARAGLREGDETWPRIRAILSKPRANSALTPGNVLVRCAEEFLAHDQPRAAHYAASLAAQWFQSSGQHVPALLRADYSAALLMLGQPAQAYDEMQRSLQQAVTAPQQPLMQARLAYFAAAAHHAQEAFVLDSAANAGTDHYPNPYVTAERARVSAALGDVQTAWTLLNDALAHGLPYAETSAPLLHADVTLRRLWPYPQFRRTLQPRG